MRVTPVSDESDLRGKMSISERDGKPELRLFLTNKLGLGEAVFGSVLIVAFVVENVVENQRGTHTVLLFTSGCALVKRVAMVQTEEGVLLLGQRIPGKSLGSQTGLLCCISRSWKIGGPGWQVASWGGKKMSWLWLVASLPAYQKFIGWKTEVQMFRFGASSWEGSGPVVLKHLRATCGLFIRQFSWPDCSDYVSLSAVLLATLQDWSLLNLAVLLVTPDNVSHCVHE